MMDWFNSNLALIVGVVFFVVLVQVSQASFFSLTDLQTMETLLNKYVPLDTQ